MTTKKARETSLLTPEQKLRLDLSDGNYNGVRTDPLYEPVPNILLVKSAVGQSGQNNTGIWQSRDQPGAPGSGYGARSGAGQIDIVAGYSSANPRRTLSSNPQAPGGEKLVSVYPDMFNDASRIMVNQKTDVDRNFDLPDGNIGKADTRAAIAIKSDNIRIIGRESIKIVSGVAENEKMSSGAELRSVPRINIIAGNSDRGGRQSLSPVAKADTLLSGLDDIFDQIDQLNSVLDTFMSAQMEFNTALALHDHFSPTLMGIGIAASGDPFSINKGRTGLSMDLVQNSQKLFATSTVAKYDGVMQKLKTASAKLNNTNPAGTKNAGSPSVFTT